MIKNMTISRGMIQIARWFFKFLKKQICKPCALPRPLNVIANIFVLFKVPVVTNSFVLAEWLLWTSASWFHWNSLSFLYLRWRCRFAIKSGLKGGSVASRGQRGSLQLLCASFRWTLLFLFIGILKAILRKMRDLTKRRDQQNQF